MSPSPDHSPEQSGLYFYTFSRAGGLRSLKLQTAGD